MGFKNIGDAHRQGRDRPRRRGERRTLRSRGTCPRRTASWPVSWRSELVASRGRARLRTLLQELYAEVGSVSDEARELPVGAERGGGDCRPVCEQPPGNVAGLAVIEVTRLDGVKLILEDGSWLLFRLSGTRAGGSAVRGGGDARSGLDRLITAGEALFGR
ncbi:MAG: hypothetical protein MZV64_70625 [Ignavibacteriales bacterium]|nr:hypothetical protein [Ignavibacteriales bacterium]